VCPQEVVAVDPAITLYVTVRVATQNRTLTIHCSIRTHAILLIVFIHALNRSLLRLEKSLFTSVMYKTFYLLSRTLLFVRFIFISTVSIYLDVSIYLSIVRN